VKQVTLVLPDGSEYPQKGKLNFAASQIDPLLGTQQLRATFDNADQKLLPGQFVRARVTTGQRDGVFLLPQVAVSTSDQGRFVFVVNEKNEATVRPVVVGDWVGKDWIILEGLNAGDKVSIDNIIKLRPGAPVVPNIAGEQPAEASPDAKEAPAQSLRTEPSTQA
jgi:membrane fusion protein (multidrug efflux system)